MALDLDPSHLPTLAALRQIAIDDADYDKAARYLDQEQSYTTAPRQRARLLVELGKLREEMLGDHDERRPRVGGRVRGRPGERGRGDAARRRVHRAARSGRRPSRSLDLLVRKSGKRERGEQHDLQNKLGQVCAALGKDDKALKAYTAAHQLDLTDQATIRGLAEVCFRLKDWGAALTNYQKVLTALGEDETEERADVYYKLGCIKREQGQAKQAINNFEKALGVDAAHRPTLEALVSLYTELKDWKQVVAYKRQILDNVVRRRRSASGCSTRSATSGTTRTRTRTRRSRRSKRRASSSRSNHVPPPQAHRALPGDRELVEDDRHAPGHRRHREGCRSARASSSTRWRSSIATRRTIRTAPSSSSTRRSISTRRSSRPSSASTRSSRRKKDWKELERAFRKMLRRMSAANVSNPDLEFNLWHNLGLIYRDRLKDMNERHRGLQDGDALQARRGGRAADPRRALRGDRPDRSGHRRARASCCRRTRCASTRTAASTSSTCGCTSTTAPGACARRSRSCTRPTKRSSASSRTTGRAG